MKTKIISLMLAVLMLVSIIPITSIIALAAATPVAYGTLVNPESYRDQRTDTAPDGTGWQSYARKMYFDPITHADGYSANEKAENFSGAKSDVPAYCINHGGKFTGEDLSKYEAYRAQDSKYFSNFSEEQKMGIVLTANFGYRARSCKDLGAKNEEDAIIATQALMWEFNLNSRTSFKGNANNLWAYEMVKGDEGAETAYWNILSAAQNFLDMGGDWREILNSKHLLIWENGDTAQVILTFTGTSENPFGSISVIKKDVHGKPLAGAKFIIYYADENSPNYGQRFGDPLVTDVNGYAITEGGTGDPSVPYGTYRIVETDPPTYTDPNGNVCEYIPVGPTSWTVVVDEEHKHQPYELYNREEKYVMVQKRGLNSSLKANKQFAIYDNATGVRLLTLETDEDGNTKKVLLPQTASEEYRWEEISEGDYTCSMWNGTTWVSDAVDWIFHYDDVEPGGTIVLEARNELDNGYGIIKKVIDANNAALSGFKFKITKNGDATFEMSGTTNAQGYFIGGNRVGIQQLDETYKLGDVDDWYGLDATKVSIDAEMKYYFLVENSVTLKDFFTEINEWDGDTENYYAILDHHKFGITTENTAPEGTMEVYQAVLLRYETQSDGSKIWVPLGYISRYSDVSDAISKINKITSAGVERVKLTDIISTIKSQIAVDSADVTYKGIFIYHIFPLDLNYDGYIGADDLTLAEEAQSRGQVTLENPVLTLEPGRYTLTEFLTDEQAKAYAAPTPIEFVIYPNETTNVKFENHQINSAIRIIKKADDGDIVGTKFKIEKKNSDGTWTTIVSKIEITDEQNPILYIDEDENGNKILAGTYRITEIEVNQKYVTPSSQTITITQDDVNAKKVIPVAFENKLKKLTLNIFKTSEDGKVADVWFLITGYNALGEYVEREEKTGADGKIALELYPGKYYVTELLPENSNYVTLDTQVIEPYIDSQGEVHDNEVKFHNIIKKFTVSLTKVDGLNGKLHGDGTLEGAVYGLYLNGELVDEATTDKNGELKFPGVYNLEIGYTVREISPSEGYYLDPTVYDIDTNPANYNDENVNISLIVTETPVFGTISIHKLKGTEEDNVPEAGAKFQVYLKSAGSYDAAPDEARDIITTDEADPTDGMGYFGGTATTKDMPYGTYVVHQLAGDDRFSFIADFEVVIDKEHINECYIRRNDITPKQITLYKKDAAQELYLEGAEFKVVDEEGNELIGTTDEDGELTFTLTPTKTYTIFENKAPEKYALNPIPVTFTLDIYGNVVDGSTTIENEYNRYSVKKVDEDGNVLPGAVFEMKNVDTGEVFATATSDKNGIAMFQAISYGTYEVREIEAPAGHKLSDKTFTITVDGTWINGESEFDDILVNSDTEVIINKIDADTEKGIPGATITVYDADGEKYAEGITDENGQFIIKNILVGKYTFQETAAPELYELNDAVFEFEVTANGEVLGDTTVSDVHNRYVVKKTDKDGKPLTGATFEMKNVETGEIFATITTGEDGLAVFENIPFGKYEVYETVAPAGYKLSDEILEVEINATWKNLPEGEFNGTIINEDTVITFSKTEITTAEGIPGATITVYDADGNVYAEGKTDKNGEYTIYNIIPGKYTFKETYAPEGFELNTTIFEFEITIEGDVIGSTNITDKPNKYIVKKTDKDGNALAGATFEMKNVETGKIFATVITDENGIALFSSIPYGTYEVRETEAPAGYKLSNEVFALVVDGVYMNLGESEFNDILVNEDTEVTFNKTDASNGEAVPGAEITVYDANGEIYAQGKTDKNGQFTIYNIIPGKYTFVETYAPDGFKLNTTVFEFEITAEGEVIGATDITNEPTEVVITKTDLTGEKTIPGAEIAIYDANGKEVFKDITDENGIVSVTYLAPGVYTFKETAAANGWAINTSTFTFTIDAEGNVTGDNTITDDVTRVKIFKVNEKKEPLEGVVFNAYDGNGELVSSITTDKNGEAVFEGLRWGEYTIKEVTTLDDYYLSEDLIMVVIDSQWDNNADAASITVINYPIPETGDASNLLIYVILAAVSVLLSVALMRRKTLSV